MCSSAAVMDLQVHNVSHVCGRTPEIEFGSWRPELHLSTARAYITSVCFMLLSRQALRHTDMRTI